MNNGKFLDLACGSHPRDGYEGVDISAIPGVVHRQDLNDKRWKWASGSVVGLHSSHFVEHVNSLVAFMDECYRILVDGGELTIQHPYQHSNRAWQDPTHVRALNEHSWDYYNAAWREENGITSDGYYPRCNFEVVSVDFILCPEWQKAMADNGWDLDTVEVRAAIRYSVNVVDDLFVTLRAIK